MYRNSHRQQFTRKHRPNLSPRFSSRYDGRFQHFGRERTSSIEVLGFCAQEVDKAMSVLVQRMKNQLLAVVDKMDAQLLTLEGNMR